ncbi:hypothetical protein ACIQYS_22305 [Psychrobacillus sp. NPDC096426]
MKKAKVWRIISILVLSMFAVGSVYAADDLPEPLEMGPPISAK